jgi:hypothetical protein
MPLGICGTCQRAFIFEDAARPGQDRCPRCGTLLRVTTVREAKDLPQLPLQLPDLEPDKPESMRTRV